MPLDPGGSDENPDGSDDNEGPHCRNCHTGASSCDQCHGATSAGVARGAYSAIDASSYTTQTAGKTPFQPGSYLHTTAVANINGQCVDGGFSFPHRTLGANMLKDELYGVDFDGTAVAVGETRDATAMTAAGWAMDNYSPTWGATHSEEATGMVDFMWSWTENGEQIDGMAAENLDSVCIDCHGDATYWNGDEGSVFEFGDGSGWDLLYKGLP